MSLDKAIRINRITNPLSDRVESNDSSGESEARDSRRGLRVNRIADAPHVNIPAAGDSKVERKSKRLPIVVETSIVSEMELDQTMAPLKDIEEQKLDPPPTLRR